MQSTDSKCVKEPLIYGAMQQHVRLLNATQESRCARCEALAGGQLHVVPALSMKLTAAANDLEALAKEVRLFRYETPQNDSGERRQRNNSTVLYAHVVHLHGAYQHTHSAYRSQCYRKRKLATEGGY